MTGGAQAACGKVTIADMNWPSATLMAHVDAMILKYGYGCDAELITGDTMPTGTSMIEKGEPDIAPELGTNSFEALQKGIDGSVSASPENPSPTAARRASGYLKYMVDEMPELATIAGVKKHAKLFQHPEDPCEVRLRRLPRRLELPNLERPFSALQLANAGFELVDPGSAAGSTVRSPRHTSASSPGSAITGHRPPSSANTRWLKSISAAASMRPILKIASRRQSARHRSRQCTRPRPFTP